MDPELCLAERQTLPHHPLNIFASETSTLRNLITKLIVRFYRRRLGRFDFAAPEISK